MTQSFKLLIFGAHPDDADFGAGGLAALYRLRGDSVALISVTDGSAGHHTQRGSELVERRRREAASAGAVIGATYEVWDFPDGHLQATLEVRQRIIAKIRAFEPDLVLTHRPFDYHPDHRAVGQAVQDACYLVTVPAVVPESPVLRKDPVVAYMRDGFQKPIPFQAHAVLDVGSVAGTLVRMLACHESQVFEWLPHNHRVGSEVPTAAPERNAWLNGQLLERMRPFRERFESQLVESYGAERARNVEYVEAFEISEYGARPDEDLRRRLFCLDGSSVAPT